MDGIELEYILTETRARRRVTTRFQGRGFPGSRAPAFSPDPWKPPPKYDFPTGPDPRYPDYPGDQPRGPNPYDPKWRPDPKWPGGRRPYWPKPRPSPWPRIPPGRIIPGGRALFGRHPWLLGLILILDNWPEVPITGPQAGGYYPGWNPDFTCQTLINGPTTWLQGPFVGNPNGTCGVQDPYPPYGGGNQMSPWVWRKTGIPRKWWNLGRWSRPVGSTTPPVWHYPPKPDIPPMVNDPPEFPDPPIWLDPFVPPGTPRTRVDPPPVRIIPDRPKNDRPKGENPDWGNRPPKQDPPPDDPDDPDPPLPPKPPKPPPPNVKEKKTYGPISKRILDLWDIATETEDAVDCILDTLDQKALRKAKRAKGDFNKYEYLWEHWDEVDAGIALSCMLRNNSTDRIVGGITRRARKHGLGFGFGGTPYRRTLTR